MTFKESHSPRQEGGRLKMAPGFTPIPNAILDSQARLTSSQLRLLLCVARATLGWQEGNGRRGSEWLSHRLLQKRTGLSSATVSRAVDSLVIRGLLSAQDEAGRRLGTPRERQRHRGRIYYSLARRALDGDGSKGHSSKPEGADEPMKSASASTEPRSVGMSEPHGRGLSEPPLAYPVSLRTSPQGLRTIKENGNKENEASSFSFDLSSLDIEDSIDIGQGNLAALRKGRGELLSVTLQRADEEVWTGFNRSQSNREEANRFLQIFIEAYCQSRPDSNEITVTDEELALLQKRLDYPGIDSLIRGVPAFFSCSFGYVRRRGYSLGSYLDCVFTLEAQRGTPNPQ